MSSSLPTGIPVGKLVSVTGKTSKSAPGTLPVSVSSPPRNQAQPWWPYVAIPGALLLGFAGFLLARAALGGNDTMPDNPEPQVVLVLPSVDPVVVKEPIATPILKVETPIKPAAPVPPVVLENEIAPFPAEVAAEPAPEVPAANPMQLPEVALVPGPAKRHLLQDPKPKAAPAPACEKFGTNIVFVPNPPDAFKQAKEEKKLVFFIHLSGNFEDKEFT